MQVKKLIITPIVKGGRSVVSNQPSESVASMLIKDRMLLGNHTEEANKIPKALKKIPKNLKGFVNPECKVVNDRKFTIYG